MRYLIFNSTLPTLKNRLELAQIKSEVFTSPEMALNVGVDVGKGKAVYVNV